MTEGRAAGEERGRAARVPRERDGQWSRQHIIVNFDSGAEILSGSERGHIGRERKSLSLNSKGTSSIHWRIITLFVSFCLKSVLLYISYSVTVVRRAQIIDKRLTIKLG